MSGVSRLSHFSSLARSSSSSSLLPTLPRGRGCSSITTTLAQQRLLQQQHQPVLQQQHQQQSFHGGDGGRFKSTTAAPAAARLKKSNESSSSLSLVSTFWDAAASTIQTSVHQSSLYFQTLRWKAANALMTSLSDSERQQLLQRLDILPTTNTSNNDHDNNSNGINLTAGADKGVEITENKSTSTTTVVLSVAEAVAAARVQEAMRSSAETSTTKSAASAAQHREELWHQAQQAANARVATEITALQQHLEKEAAASSANDKNDIATNVDKECSILGPVVYDLGYKRCHVVSACQLTSIPVWERQRIYRHDRAKNMAKDKLKTLHLGMPGVISLHEDLQGNLSILDGQHRVGMMAILAEEMQQQQDANSSNNSSNALDLTMILVEVYPERACAPTTSNSDSSSSSHAADLFVEINKAEPVKLVDLPGMGAKKSEANVINQGAHLVQERFPEMFSASQRCRAPHLNLDNLRDALFQAQVVTRAKLKSPKALEMWLLEQNDVLKQKYQYQSNNNNNANGGEEEATTSSWSISKAALEKARKYDFYLGLETSWLSK